MTITLRSLLATACVGMVFSTAQAASLSNNSVVRDSYGNPVRSLAHGTCTRTNWAAGYDECARKVHHQAVSAPRTLETAEKTVYFAFDKAELTPQAKARLSTIARELRTAEDVRSATIVGFADRIGTTPYNDALSEKRAEAVQNFLHREGYLNTNLAEVRGLGERRPVSNCEGEGSRASQISCLQPDRRVEVEIEYIDAAQNTSINDPRTATNQ